MDPRRWEQIQTVFDEVVEAGETERAARLAEISTRDPGLKAAVDDLLKADARADAWLAPVESAFALPEGMDARHAHTFAQLQPRLQASLGGAYRIERELGGGGMSCVFVAEETAFRRLVVIKVLRPDYAEAVSAQRFQREIQLAARLQHPFIVPLLSAGEADRLLYYTMPFVEGESLRERLRREGELPIDDTVRILRDVAAALAYAHGLGVVHRDIKPENVLLSHGGAVVADFGIAKALSSSRASGYTLMTNTSITARGVAIGTPLYMAPEQAADNAGTDHRADLYALGAIGYEMLAGKPPFEGRSSQQLIAAHAVDMPEPVARRRPTTPPRLAALVMRCLEKRPADRFQSAEEVLAALNDAVTARVDATHPSFGASTQAAVRGWTPMHLPARVGAEASALNPGRRAFPERRHLVMAVIASVLVAGAALAGSRWASQEAGAPSVSFVVEPPAGTGVHAQQVGAIAVSRDGTTIAYVARTDSGPSVYLRRLSEVETQRVPGTDDAFELAFSPDGRSLAVMTWFGKLLHVPLDGSAPMTIGENLFFWAGVTWESDRTLLATKFERAEGISRLSLTGGAPRPLTRAKPGRDGHAHPVLAPDGETLIFIDWGVGALEDDFLAIGSAKTGAFATTSLLAVQPIAVIDDWIVYLSPGGVIMAVPFDARRLRVTGAPLRVLEGVAITGTRQAALSSAGALLYRRGQFRYRISLIDRLGVTRELSTQEHEFFTVTGLPAFSPDGRQIAAVILAPAGDSIAYDLWTFDVRTRTFSQLTRTGNVRAHDWTPDGRYLVFSGGTPFNLFGTSRLWRQVADGSQPPEKLVVPPEGAAIMSHSVTPDGRGVLYCLSYTGSAGGLFYIPFRGDRTPTRVASIPPDECFGRLSPDGRWWAYTASDGRKSQVFVRSFSGTATRVQVSDDGGNWPVWSRDGSHLYYRHAPDFEWFSIGTIVAARLEPSPRGLMVADRQRLFQLRAPGGFEVAPDGHFLILESTNAPELLLTTNWLSQLRARLHRER